jgi:hypothetical protein
MTARDAALGLSTGWIRGVVSALLAISEGPRALQVLAERINEASDPESLAGENGGLCGATLWPHVAGLLGVEDLNRWIRREEAPARRAKAEACAVRLLLDLREELRSSIALIDTSTMKDLLTAQDPELVVQALFKQSAIAKEEWKDSRKQVMSPDSGRGEPRSSRTVLFAKKRVTQLARLMQADLRLAGLIERAGSEPLRELGLVVEVIRTDGHVRTRRSNSAGREYAAMGVAMEERRVRLLAGQVAEVTVCGAVPPYNAVMGGKLAALLAMSRDVVSVWRDSYRDQVSDITSLMANRPVVRPSELVALTTTGFYGVGNSQYNRAVLPAHLGGRRWREVGLTAGNGTLHLSDALVNHLVRYHELKVGGRLITSTFGEGPSERLRKLRDGLVLLGLPADDILLHGYKRLIFVTSLSGGPPYREGEGPTWSIEGPSAADIASHWRERWLAPRLRRAVLELADPEIAPRMLSERYPQELAVSAQLEAGVDGQPIVEEGLPPGDGMMYRTSLEGPPPEEVSWAPEEEE